MVTPSGTDCRYYYQDFHRGRGVQECRLLKDAEDSLPWEERVCAICPVPAILRANGCSHMHLHARLVRRWPGRRKMVVTAHCSQQQTAVKDPYVGCGHCHPTAAAVLIPSKEEDR
jgi:hypothetical protein